MSSSTTWCDRCKAQRWLMKAPRFRDDKMTAEVHPFDRAAWRLCGDGELSALLVSKAVVACSACNPDALAPWHKSFAAESPKGGGANGFD